MCVCVCVCVCVRARARVRVRAYVRERERERERETYVCNDPYKRREWRDLRGKRRVAGGRHSCRCFRRLHRRGVRRRPDAGVLGGTCERTSHSEDLGSDPADSSDLGRTEPVRTNLLDTLHVITHSRKLSPHWFSLFFLTISHLPFGFYR